MSAAADVLNKAADLIERDGWTQGTYQLDGKRCVDGAISATSHDWSTWRNRKEARELLRDTIGAQILVDWNDAPGRTKTEVVAALRAAAERAA